MSNPFPKQKQKDRFGRVGETYEGQNGIEYLFHKALPHLLLRNDQRVACICATEEGGTGHPTCLRCFGTGKVVYALERVAAYISKSSPSPPAPPSPQGWEERDIKLAYTGRWVYPEVGNYILEIGWDVPAEEIYARGRVRTVDGVYLIKQVNRIGFSEIVYMESFVVPAMAKRAYMEMMLLHGGSDLPPMINRLAPADSR